MRILALIKALIINILFLLTISFSTKVLNKPMQLPILEKIMPASIVDEARIVKQVIVNKPSSENNLKSQQHIDKKIISAEQLLKKTERRKKQEQDILNKIIKQWTIETKKLAKEREKAEKLTLSQQKVKKREKAEELARSQAKKRKKAEELAQSQAKELKEAEELAQSQAKELKKAEARSKENSQQATISEIEFKKQLQKTVKLLQNEVSQYWTRPRGFYGGLSCVIKITLQIGGIVDKAAVVTSSGNIAFDHSAILAVQNSSPLPIPNELFTEFQEFNFEFKK